MAKSIHSERYRRIIEAARRKDGEAGTDTMIVNSHLSQMKLFMLRQGIEFYPSQDSYGYRKAFLDELIVENEIDCRLEGIVDDFLIDGKGLFYFRPVGKSYRIIWFNKENYRAYYDAKGELDELELIYSFEIKGDLGALAAPSTDGSSERYVKLTVRRDTIIETITAEKPSFDIGMGLQALNFSTGTTRTLINSLGFIPGIECFNSMKSTGMDASGEFDWVAEQIVVHDDLMKNIRTNIHFFGNPTLVSSRPKHDLLETGDEKGMRPTISSQAGFAAMERASSRSSAPSGASGTGLKIPRIIANIEPTDRAVYLTPDAVSGDHNTYARQYREELLTALGGVDELGISSGATAYEIKSLYGRAATTASRKCRGLLTYGLCKLLQLIIYNEEQVFRDSFAAAIGLQEIPVPVKEQFPDDPEGFAKALQDFTELTVVRKQRIELGIKQAVETMEMPPNVEGLIPDGDRKIEWRWKGPVFEDGTEDILNNSIVVRNLQELGVNSIEALRYLFPDKTDEERSGMLSGYPFRMAQATQQSIGTFLSLVSQMSQVPHPQAPDVPMLADPKLDLTPYVYRALDFLKRELTYAGKYSDATGAADPTVLGALERERARRGLDTSASEPGTTFSSDGSSPNGASPDGQSVGSGVPESGRQPEQSADLPVPGSLLRADPTGQQSAARGLSLNGGGGLPNNSGTQFGAADLLAPSNAGLFPGTSAAGETGAKPAAGRGKRRVSGRRKS
tara:strand:+ start:313 stop:2517 length:2205 start_codon:yes stop_codon:yes gene_type:complete